MASLLTNRRIGLKYSNGGKVEITVDGVPMFSPDVGTLIRRVTFDVDASTTVPTLRVEMYAPNLEVEADDATVDPVFVDV